MDKKIEVAYISDEKFINLTAISIYSLLSNRGCYNVKIWFIGDGISSGSKEKLETLLKNFGQEIVFVDAVNLKANFPIPKTVCSNVTVYNKLFLASVIDADKIIYIDGDTIILTELIELWTINLEDKYIAAVQDTTGLIERAEAGIGKNELYINSGVMLCNLKLWRKEQLEKKYIDYMNKHRGSYIFRDQRVINAVCKNKIMQIAPCYNLLPDYIRFTCKENCMLHQSNMFYGDNILNYARKNPCIIHYAGRAYNRPWYEECIHPMKEIFEKYEKESGFFVEREKYKLKKRVWIEKMLIQYAPNALFVVIANINNRLKKRL